MVAGLLHPAIQSPAPFVGSSFWGPLQSASGGRPPRRRISTASLRLCASESCARRDAGQQGEVHRYRWSSCAHYLTTKKKRPAWLRTDRLMGEHGLVSENARSRREFGRRMESLRQEANSPQLLQPIRRGWKLGGEDFLDWILDKMEVTTKEAHPSRERDETEQVKALRIVQKELMRLGWTKAELRRRRKGDETKIALARRLREETAVSLRWIAENLYMGTWTHVSNRLYHCAQ